MRSLRPTHEGDSSGRRFRPLARGVAICVHDNALSDLSLASLAGEGTGAGWTLPMFIVESTIHLATPLARVWRLLIDLDHYSDWHPFVSLAGSAAVGSELTYNYRTRMRAIPEVTSTADLVRLDRHAAIAWKLGIKWLLEVEETFQLAKSDRGTVVTHSICCSGILSALAVKRLKNGLEKSVVVTNQSLGRFLKRGTTIARYSLQNKRTQ